MQFIGLGGAVTLGQSAAAQIRVNRPAREVITARNPPAYLSIKLLRPYYLLSLELRYYNFTTSGNSLQKKGNPAYLVVIFQPQTMSEQAWNEPAEGPETPAPLPGRIVISGETRLVFEIPAEITSVGLNTHELLAWEKYHLVVNERAKQPATRKLINPVLNSKVNNVRTKLAATGAIKRVPSVKGLTKDEKLTINSLLIPDDNNPCREVITNLPGGVNLGGPPLKDRLVFADVYEVNK